MILLFLACTGDPTANTYADTSGGPLDTLGTPIAEAEVVIIGGGASGLSAAQTALELGADVLIIEREATLGGAGVHAGNFFGAATPWQEAAGIDDSVEQALSEWEDFTNGGDPTHPWVENFVADSADTLLWLSEHGAAFSEITHDPGAGETHRIHPLRYGDGHGSPIGRLGAQLTGHALLSTTALALVEDDGAVVGVTVQTADGSQGWVSAGAVIVATGGFARNDDRVYEAIPELLEFPRYVEAWPGMDGNGLDLIEAVGGSLSNLPNIALYAHGVTDAYHGAPEVMVMVGLSSGIVVDATGQRVMDEEDLRAVWGGRKALEVGQLHVIFDSRIWSNTRMNGLGYNYDSVSDGQITAETYAKKVEVTSAGDPSTLGSRLGVDGDALAATLEDYNDMVEAGEDTAFGKDLTHASTLTNAPFYGLPLVMGTGKSFGGAAMAVDGGVIGADGATIPGLYAAGEVAGVLGGTHLGQGISGSITAVVYSGRVAGAGAVGWLE